MTLCVGMGICCIFFINIFKLWGTVDFNYIIVLFNPSLLRADILWSLNLIIDNDS